MTSVILKIDTVKAPAFAALSYSDTEAEIGGNVSHHTNGKGYTLQMSPNEYYAYVYVTDKTPSYAEDATETYVPKYAPSNEVYVKELTITYDIGGGATLMTRALSDAKGIKYVEVKDPDAGNKPISSTATNGSLKFILLNK